MPVSLILNTAQRDILNEAVKAKRMVVEYKDNSLLVKNDQFIKIVDAVNEYYFKLYLKSQKGPMYSEKLAITEIVIKRLETIRSFFEEEQTKEVKEIDSYE